MSPPKAQDVALATKAWSLSAERRASKHNPMPFTVGYLQRWAKALGYPMAEKRAAAAIHELQRRKVLTQQSRYRGKRHGYWVVTYRLPSISLSVRKTRLVKRTYRPCNRRNWWIHSLFGTADGRKPP